ncbi:hypothetical protein A8D98_37765 [Burkholderia cenocepacia]|nr:hypothetical protein A8D98_37765 [Burkholderia cenocepacia]
MKMALVALIAVLAFTFQRSVRRHDQTWESAIVSRPGLKWAAMATFLIWIAIIFLGRFIAYDTVWSHVFPGTKA